MKAICLVILSLALAYANIFSYENNVVVLTTSNFDQALQDFDYVLVEFYAPWCGHCKRLEPEYAGAALQLSESNPNVKLAKVDATVEESLAEKFEIGGFPTLLFFKKGDSTPIHYNGGRTTPEIINWIKKKIEGPTAEVNSVADIEKAIAENEALGLFLGDASSNNFAEFLSAATQFDDLVFINSNNEDVKAKFGASEDTLIVFTANGEEKNTHTGEFKAEGLTSFINSNRFPIIMPFNQNAAQRIFGESLDAIFLVVADNEKGKAAVEALKSIASEIKGQIVISVGKIEEDMGGRLAEYLGIEEDELPAVRIVQPSNDMKKFVLDQELTGENLKNFVSEFKKDNLKPYYKSEDIPAEPYDGNVRVVVGKNFEEVVLDENKDVFIEYYAPWCGHCQSLAPIYDAFAAKLKHVENIVIAKMDAIANEVPNLNIEGFPTLRFYPRNNKREPIEFEEERSEEGLLDFVFNHKTVELPGVERPTIQRTEEDSHDHHHDHDHDHAGHDHGHHHNEDL